MHDAKNQSVLSLQGVPFDPLLNAIRSSFQLTERTDSNPNQRGVIGSLLGMKTVRIFFDRIRDRIHLEGFRSVRI